MIVQDGLRRMYAEQEDVFYYITVLNENYEHPAMPEGAEEGILKGMYLFRKAPGPRRQQGHAGAAAGQRHDPARGHRGGRPAGARTAASPPTSGACPASPSCARDGDRRRALEPAAPDRDAAPEPMSRQCLAGRSGPVVASTDYMRLFADQIRPYVPRRYQVLGTDGFGRSDYRTQAAPLLRGRPPLGRPSRRSRRWPTEGAGRAQVVAEAIAKYGIDPDKPNPMTV